MSLAPPPCLQPDVRARAPATSCARCLPERQRPGPEIPDPALADASLGGFPRGRLAAGSPAAAPRLKPALGVHTVGNVDLLRLRGLAGIGRILAAARANPSLDIELQSA